MSLSALRLVFSATNSLSLSWTALSHSAVFAANAASCCFTKSECALSIAALAAGSRCTEDKLAVPGAGTFGVCTGDTGDGTGTEPTGGGAGEATGAVVGADTTEGGTWEPAFGPAVSVVDFRRSFLLASCLLL